MSSLKALTWRNSFLDIFLCLNHRTLLEEQSCRNQEKVRQSAALS